MARAKYGAIITEIKGKIGGTVFQGSRTGGVVKNKPNNKTSSGTSKLTKADAGRLFLPQNTIAQLATTWRDLSAMDQLAWNTAAPSYPFTDKYGNPYTGSGYQLYMSMNTNNAVVGGNYLSTPPAPFSLAAAPVFSVDWSVPGTATMNLPLGVPVDYVMQLYATQAMSLGRKPSKGDYKLIALFTPGVVFPFNIIGNFRDAFGSELVGGQVWFSGKLTKADAGRNTPSYVANAVVS